MNEMYKRLTMFGIGVLAGLALWFFCPKQNYTTITKTETVVRTVEKVKQQTKWRDRTITITEPGKTTVIVEKEGSKTDTTHKEDSKTDTKNTLTPTLSRYSLWGGAATNLSLKPEYVLGVDARVGNLPVFIGVWGGYPTPVVGLSVRWEM